MSQIDGKLKRMVATFEVTAPRQQRKDGEVWKMRRAKKMDERQ